MPFPPSTPPTRSWRGGATREVRSTSSARLVKLGIAIGAQAEGAIRSHARRALAEQRRPEELRHVGLLALTTIGFPHTVAGRGWTEEVIERKS